jgi:hypothetical protein
LKLGLANHPLSGQRRKNGNMGIGSFSTEESRDLQYAVAAFDV